MKRKNFFFNNNVKITISISGQTAAPIMPSTFRVLMTALSCFCVRWQGLSFLDLRYHLLLFYLQDLTHLISIKTEGGRIGESEALSRVLGVRTVR